MTGTATRIMKRVRVRGRGKWVFGATDFLDIGKRPAVDQALSRLAKKEDLRRIGPGLYDRPRISRVLNGPAPADMDAVIAAIARRDNVRIVRDGAAAANQLGLTNAVPAKAGYLTDGPSRVITVDGRTIRLRHAGPRVMSWAHRPAGPVVQALRWLGKDNLKDTGIVTTLASRLPDVVKKDIVRHRRYLPGWVADLARDLETPENPAECPAECPAE